MISFMGPVLCLIRQTEILFAKKLTDEEKALGLKEYRTFVRRLSKSIRPGERMMIIGLSSQPYRARVKAFVNFYPRIILFPRPNYGSRRSKRRAVGTLEDGSV
jgi:hypothetical protein